MEDTKDDLHSSQDPVPTTSNSSADAPSHTDNLDTESHRTEASVEDSVVAAVQENITYNVHIVSHMKETSVEDSVVSVVEENDTDHVNTESHREETSIQDSVASVVEGNKDPSKELPSESDSVDDAKIVSDETVSVHIGPSQLETEKATSNTFSNKSANGISVGNSDIRKHSYAVDKKISEDGRVYLAKPSVEVKVVKKNRGLVDTSAPFESVKEAVTKFGGIVDWKSHRAQILERRRLVQLELEKIKEDIPLYKEQSEAAENAKAVLLKELEETKRSLEELKLSLERAQTEESQAKQDLELVLLRVKEIDQGIAGEASVAAKAQVDVVKARYNAAIAELKSVKKELNSLQDQHDFLMNEKDNAMKRAEEAVNASRDIERTVEDLTMELISAREALESAHASHMEAEEHRIGTVLARDQDVLDWEKEVRQAESELHHLNEKMLSVKDLQSKLTTASTLLCNLKTELAAYMEAQLTQESVDAKGGEAKNQNEIIATHDVVQEKVASIKKETEDVNSSIEKAKEEAKFLNMAALSLKSELEAEKAALNNMKQREGMASIAVQSLEAELNRIRKEIEEVQAREKEIKDELVKLPEALQQASWEADEAKSVAHGAFEELRKAKEEVEQVNATASTIQSRLNASLKEIEAAKASESIAMAAIKALQESEHSASTGQVDLDAAVQVSIPLNDYYALSKQAYEAEEQANQRVSAAISQIQVAKVSESQALDKLAEANHERDAKKEALRLARERAEKATQGKLGAEQELRKWRADNERRRKAVEASQVVIQSSNPQRSSEEKKESTPEWGKAYVAHGPSRGMVSFSEDSTDSVAGVKSRRTRSFFPRFVRLLIRKKPQTTG